MRRRRCFDSSPRTSPAGSRRSSTLAGPSGRSTRAYERRRHAREAPPVVTVGSSWPYATSLFDYVRRAMPFQAPQLLTNEEVYAVSAYVLHMNGILPEDAVLDPKTLPQVKMPNRDGFIAEDPRPDVKSKP